MNFQIGDNVIICSESTPYFLEKGIIQSIDLYGNIKVKLKGKNEVNIKVKREELKLVFKSRNSPYLDNPSFIHHMQNKYGNKTMNHRTFIENHIKQLIDLSLDTRDKEWFIQLTKRLKNDKSTRFH
jgi:uncharacterized protein YpiB (UPF0302 family)